MKKTFAALLFAASVAHAATATWTGRSEIVTTVTYQQAWRCEYSYAGQTFYRLFPIGSGCPASVEVQ